MRSLGWAAACGLLAVGVAGCRRPAAAEPPSFPPAAVTVAKPVSREVTEYREYTGRLEAVKKYDVRARVRGFLEKVHFAEGCEVKKGDLLYEIDPRTFQADLAKAEADLARAEAMLRLAVSEADRAARLRGGAMNEEEYQQKVAARETARAAIQQAQAAVRSNKLELEFTKIYSPIDGRIGRTLVTEGNLVGFNEPTLLTTVVSLDPVYVYFEGPERDLLEYQRLVREKAAPSATDKTVPLQLALETDDDFPHAGVVDFFDNQVDGNTGTILCRGLLPNPKRLLSPGLFARVRIPFGKAQKRLVVPEDALAADQRGRYVLTVKADDTVEVKPVTVAQSLAGYAAIVKGLTPSDRVIVNGQVKARPGSKVAPTETELKVPADLNTPPLRTVTDVASVAR
jgi:RND family efflux transporter MFP subunit